jgi:hypothetical protein
MSLRFIAAPIEPALANSGLLCLLHPLRLPALPRVSSSLPHPEFMGAIAAIPRSSSLEWNPNSLPVCRKCLHIAPTPFILIEFGAQCGFSVVPESITNRIRIAAFYR